MPRVLIVSPHFPPSSTPDMHRVRSLLPYLRGHGWEATVLAVEPEQVGGTEDPWLAEGLPHDVPVHRVKALGLGWARVPGLGTLGFRALPALARAGDRLLSVGGFDLVYFSTTVFEVHMLGPRWKHRFGVPFMMDYQDPWVNDYYREHPEVSPPGGRLKYALADRLHRRMEPHVLRYCAGITSVSPAYPEQLARRYPWLVKLPTLIQPFPGSQRDFDRLGVTQGGNEHFDVADGNIHWVYVGVVIPGMFPALRALFKAINTAFPAQERSRLRIHFLGTSYAPCGLGKHRVIPLASEYGLDDCIDERCDRIPYLDALRCLTTADALLAIGSDDPGYTASKIYPYLLARKPLLAIYRAESSVVSLLREVGGAVCVEQAAQINEDALAEEIAKDWLSQRQFAQLAPLDMAAFQTYTDRSCAAVLCEFFEIFLRSLPDQVVET